MVTQEIARRDWQRRLEAFAAVHEGWLVSIEVRAPDLGAQRQVVNMPLTGLSIDSPEGDAIGISVGLSGETHLTHTIRGVTHVYLDKTAEAADAALTIESGDGGKTILRLKTPVLPVTVDGLVRR